MIPFAPTPEQARVVALAEGQHLVAAGPGAGKTATLVARVAALVFAGWLAARILVVTFTKGAAREFAGRLPLECADVEVRTWHAWGYRVLREEGLAKGVLEDRQQLAILRGLWQDRRWQEAQDVGFLPEGVLKWISACKRDGILPRDSRLADRARKMFGTRYADQACEAYRYYDAEGWQQGQVDFDDMVLRTSLLLEDDAVAARWTGRYDHVLVDETQDNSVGQWSMVRRLAAATHSMMAVGDIRQSIYRFAGAVPDSFVGYARSNGVQLHSITINHRSTCQIADACCRLMEHSPAEDRLGEPFRALRDGPAVEWHPTHTTADQAAAVVAGVKADLTAGLSPKWISVLYRVRKASASIERALLDAQIPYVVRGGRSFWSLRHIRVVLDYLRVALGDGESIAKVVNLPKRYLGRVFSEQAAQQGWDLDRCDRAFARGKFQRGWRSLSEAIRALRRGAAAGADSAQIVAQILDQRDSAGEYTLRQTLTASSGDADSDGGTASEDLEYLTELAREYPLPGDLLAHADRMAAASKPASADEEPPDAVVLQTIHRSKGTEYQSVHVIGCCEGQLPHGLAIRADLEALPPSNVNVREERRILFVAMSRAASMLRLYATAIDGFGRPVATSRFVREAGLLPVVCDDDTDGYATEEEEA